MRAILLAVALAFALAPLAGAKAALDVRTYVFTPARLDLEPGEEVRVTNADSEPHAAKARDGSRTFVDVPAFGEANFTAPTAPGEYPYFCPYHTSADDAGDFMKGVLVVRNASSPPSSSAPPPSSGSKGTPDIALPLALAGFALVALLLRKR